jgi:hypothetical protein
MTHKLRGIVLLESLYPLLKDGEKASLKLWSISFALYTPICQFVAVAIALSGHGGGGDAGTYNGEMERFTTAAIPLANSEKERR